MGLGGDGHFEYIHVRFLGEKYIEHILSAACPACTAANAPIEASAGCDGEDDGVSPPDAAPDMLSDVQRCTAQDI
jgi:hypothetical protein